jgi:hypothetical protein
MKHAIVLIVVFAMVTGVAAVAWGVGFNGFLQRVVQSDATGAVFAPVSATAPAGTEAGLYVRVVSSPASGGGTSSSFGVAFPATGTAAGAQAVTTAPVTTSGNMVSLYEDTGGLLRVRCDTGCAAAGDTVATGTIIALNGAVSVAHAGQSSVGVLLTGTWTATITPQVSYDGGTTWASTFFVNPTTGVPQATTVANGSFAIADTAGSGNVRVTATAFTSGTVTVTLRSAASTDTFVHDDLEQVGGANVALGQALMAASFPVVIASNQSAIPALQSGVWTVGLAAGSNLAGGVKLYDTAGVNVASVTASNAAAANALQALAGQFNTVLPVVTSGNAVFLQTDSSGRLLVAQATASILNATVTQAAGNWADNIAQIAGAAASTAAAGVLKVGAVGNAGAAFDAAQNALAPANPLAAWCVFNTTLPAITSGNLTALQCDSSGRLLVGSIAGALPAGANTIGGVNAIQSTAAALSGAWPVKPTDGTTAITVKAASTAPATTDTAQVVGIAPNPSPECTGVVSINQTASAQLVTGVAAQKIYVCSIVIVSAAAQNVSLVEGTGATCAVGTAGLIGGAAASMSLAVNGGVSSVASRPWMKSITAADNICLLQSGVGNISGVLTFVSAP